MFTWAGIKRHDNKFSFCESVLLNKTRSPSFPASRGLSRQERPLLAGNHRLFLGFLLSFLLCNSFFLRLKMKREFVLLSYDFCHLKYKRNYHVTNCQIIPSNTIHCSVIFITIRRIPEINRYYFQLTLGVKQWVQILFYSIELTLPPPTSKLAE